MRSIRLQTLENRLKSNFIARPTVQLMACATFRLVYKPTCWRQTTTAVFIPLEFGSSKLELCCYPFPACVQADRIIACIALTDIARTSDRCLRVSAGWPQKYVRNTSALVTEDRVHVCVAISHAHAIRHRHSQSQSQNQSQSQSRSQSQSQSQSQSRS